ncbi:N-terminal acetyltransferase, putative [Entamoeba dispar SAW760]|uniref:N-alpha-acetyltransferase 60 n=1 Tax=Entamoeba dispar (strain ATCC PRA-260 / SAW760) TaxID=370354 RepID=B0EQY0_ENTDS|nr:N-terminal acetyltransferase, putative [Entamoeba dispar SAW760]EDR23056.1 N-terminal acetyltransferase, putative [Entamoeba dispar SAW760]|eukprot:EDR23056.1 N-terminal acetyltransferase, putative [Entamoeba dispar SAW760]
MNKLFIRKAEHEDLRRVKELHDNLLCVKYGHHFYEQLINGHGYILLVAVLNAQIIGFASFRIEWLNQKEEITTQAGLLTLGVDRKYQTQGIGGYLLEKGCSYMKELGVSSVYLHALASNTPVHSFYQNHYFIHEDTVKNYYHFDKTYQDAFVFRRKFDKKLHSHFSYWMDSVLEIFETCCC